MLVTWWQLCLLTHVSKLLVEHVEIYLKVYPLKFSEIYLKGFVFLSPFISFSANALQDIRGIFFAN